ncbi:MAG: hypothetical protein WCP95_15440 [Actinomycetes bacterium]
MDRWTRRAITWGKIVFYIGSFWFTLSVVLGALSIVVALVAWGGTPGRDAFGVLFISGVSSVVSGLVLGAPVMALGAYVATMSMRSRDR